MTDPAAVPEERFSPVRVILVGLGGIGSKLVEDLARYMMYTKEAPKELILIDGDTYSQKNLERQTAAESDVGEPKAKIWAEVLAREFTTLQIRAIKGYVGEPGMKKDNVVTIDTLPMEGALTILGVDNHPTRKLFCDYFQKQVTNGVLLSGGNEKTDGSILTSARLNGVNHLPPIDAFHPEIRSPKGKNPAELSCAELGKLEGGTQVIWANKMAATLMGNAVYAVCSVGIQALVRQSEVYFDCVVNAARPVIRQVSEKEVEIATKLVETKPAAKAPKKSAKKSTKVAPKKKGTASRRADDEIKIVEPAVLPEATIDDVDVVNQKK